METTFPITQSYLTRIIKRAAKEGAKEALKEVKAIQGWVSAETMMERAGKTPNQLEYLRSKHPEIYRHRKSDAVDKNGKAIRRGIEYKMEAYNNLFNK